MSEEAQNGNKEDAGNDPRGIPQRHWCWEGGLGGLGGGFRVAAGCGLQEEGLKKKKKNLVFGFSF